MINFIKDNIELIVLVGACLVDIVLFVMTIFKRKVDPSLTAIIAHLPGFLLAAESRFGSGNGFQKKKYVMELAIAQYRQLTGVSVDEDSFVYRSISRVIEEILETPQKKGK